MPSPQCSQPKVSNQREVDFLKQSDGLIGELDLCWGWALEIFAGGMV